MFRNQKISFKFPSLFSLLSAQLRFGVPEQQWRNVSYNKSSRQFKTSTQNYEKRHNNKTATAAVARVSGVCFVCCGTRKQKERDRTQQTCFIIRTRVLIAVAHLDAIIPPTPCEIISISQVKVKGEKKKKTQNDVSFIP